MSTDNSEDLELIVRLKNGDNLALNEIINKYGKEIYNFLLRKVDNAEDSRDLAQETFVKVYIYARNYSDKYNFKTWLYTIALNLAKNHLRWKSRHPDESIESIKSRFTTSENIEIPSKVENPSEIAERNEMKRKILKAIDELPETQKDVVILCELQDLSVMETAKVLKTSPKSVESHLYRARKILREKLKEYL